MKQKHAVQVKSARKQRRLSPAPPAPDWDADPRLLKDEQGLERIVFFSDAVMAIAITLLALEIRLPPLPQGVDNGPLLAALGGLWPHYISYMISFLVIGRIWFGHHRTFRFVRRYDQNLMLLNIFLLMVIGFLPFPTAVIGEYGNAVGTIFYAASMAAAGLLFALLWWYAYAGGRLVAQALPRSQFRRMWARVWSMPLIFLFSMPIALRSPTAARFSWLLMLVPIFWNVAEERRMK